MDRTRTTSKSTSNSKQPNAHRRSFVRKTGMVFSAVLASAVTGISKATPDETGALKEQVARLSNQLGIIEDTNAIRKLHHAYGYYLNKMIWEDIVNLFAEDGEVHFNGGIFEGKDKGVRRLYIDNFGKGFAGNNFGPVQGFLLDQTQVQDVVEVAPGRESAKGRFHCLMQMGAQVVSDSPLMEMARQQGQGILQWWEGGIYDNTYVRDGDAWKIRKLDYHALWQADYALGWAYAKPGDIRPFSITYPEDPIGPDQLIAPTAQPQFRAEVVDFRYPHPVTGRLWIG
ncbi:MAG: hypothetical protein H6Q07_1541 [Acidobacteria bacterium]|nr:hypothetical protein [Acidobacteriota bacterium]